MTSRTQAGTTELLGDWWRARDIFCIPTEALKLVYSITKSNRAMCLPVSALPHQVGIA